MALGGCANTTLVPVLMPCGDSGVSKPSFLSVHIPHGFSETGNGEDFLYRRERVYARANGRGGLVIVTIPSKQKWWADTIGESETDDQMQRRLDGGPWGASVKTIGFLEIDGRRWPIRKIIDRDGIRIVFGCRIREGAILIFSGAANRADLDRMQHGFLRVVESLQIENE